MNTVGCLDTAGGRWITGLAAGGVLTAALVAPAAADHAGPARPAGDGIPVLAWLFGLGVVVLLALVAWAVFAPTRDDEEPAGSSERPSSPDP